MVLENWSALCAIEEDRIWKIQLAENRRKIAKSEEQIKFCNFYAIPNKIFFYKNILWNNKSK